MAVKRKKHEMESTMKVLLISPPFIPGPVDPPIVILPWPPVYVEPEPTLPKPPKNGNSGIVPPWLQPIMPVPTPGPVITLA